MTTKRETVSEMRATIEGQRSNIQKYQKDAAESAERICHLTQRVKEYKAGAARTHLEHKMYLEGYEAAIKMVLEELK